MAEGVLFVLIRDQNPELGDAFEEVAILANSLTEVTREMD